jgi:hypothetical protein
MAWNIAETFVTKNTKGGLLVSVSNNVSDNGRVIGRYEVATMFYDLPK